MSAYNIPALGRGHADIDDIAPAGLSSSQANGKTARLIMANVRYCQGWDLGGMDFPGIYLVHARDALRNLERAYGMKENSSGL